MNIFSKMNQMVDLTNSEKTLVQFMKEHYIDFSSMSIDEVCNVCYISKPTVYRLCKKLSIPGFSELKLLATRDYKDYIGERTLDYDFPIKSNETQYEIIKNIQSIYKQTITSTYNLADLEQLRLTAEEMKKAKHIDIYTSAGNVFFAENFQFQMLEMGIHVNVPIEEYQQHLSAASSDKNHIAIIISFGGRGRIIEDIAAILNERKTPIILISSTEDNPLKKYTSRHHYMASYENHFNKISSFSTRLSLLYILDCIFGCYFKLDYEHNLDEKLNIYKRMKIYKKKG